MFVGFFAFGILGVGAIVGLYFYVKPDLPSVETLRDVRFQTPMQVFTKDGKLISQFGEQRRIPVTFEELPKQLIDAVLATEDARFYEHFGIDPIGVVRAFSVLLSTGEIKEGASTITMQVARNFFLTRDKVWTRKIKEAFIALHIESLLSKEEIITLYMNKPGLGHRAFGVAAAAQVYYGRSLNELTLAELATIAGLFQAPSAQNPISNPARALQRRRVVLRRMLDTGVITQEEYEVAYNAPVTGSYHVAKIEVSAPYVAEMVRQEMVDRYGEEKAYNSGMRVYTTVTTAAQEAAESALRENLHEYDERHGYRGAVVKLWGYDAAEVNSLKVGGAMDSATLQTIQTHQGQPWDNATIQQHLNRQPRYGRLISAVVLEVKEQTADVMLRGGERVTLPWQAIDWARQFLDHDRQGRAPQTAAEILTAGDQIWVREVGNELRLAQLPGPSSAVVGLDPQTGAAQAIVGGYSFNESQYNRAMQAKRQVGSTIKPFIYAAALDNGFTLSTLVNDAPITQWNPGTNSAWRPRNSPEVYDGPIRLREAIARSKNVVSVRLLRSLGVNTVADYLLRFGFSENDITRSEALSLGSASFTPMEMARGFAVFANGGFLIEPYFISHINDADGNEIFRAKPVLACLECEALQQRLEQGTISLEELSEEQQQLLNIPLAPRVISEQIAFLISDALSSSIWGGGSWPNNTGWNGTAWRAQALRNRNISGKTGTTNEVKDAWFAGIMRGSATIFWVGYDNLENRLGRVTLNSNLGRQRQPIVGSDAGGTTALPGWVRYMKDILPQLDTSPYILPAGMTSARIDQKSGQLSRRTDYTSTFEYFIQGTEPTKFVEQGETAPLIFEDVDNGLF
nr:PBP1A family penicillin-binding protein [Aliidiomarina quisquiliarum]